MSDLAKAGAKAAVEVDKEKAAVQAAVPALAKAGVKAAVPVPKHKAKAAASAAAMKKYHLYLEQRDKSFEQKDKPEDADARPLHSSSTESKAKSKDEPKGMPKRLKDELMHEDRTPAEKDTLDAVAGKAVKAKSLSAETTAASAETKDVSEDVSEKVIPSASAPATPQIVEAVKEFVDDKAEDVMKVGGDAKKEEENGESKEENGESKLQPVASVVKVSPETVQKAVDKVAKLKKGFGIFLTKAEAAAKDAAKELSLGRIGA